MAGEALPTGRVQGRCRRQLTAATKCKGASALSWWEPRSRSTGHGGVGGPADLCWRALRLGLLEAALVYEEIGRAMAPVPHFVSAVISARILVEAGSDQQKETWLPKIASGEAILTPAWLEPNRGYGEAGIQMSARKSISSRVAP